MKQIIKILQADLEKFGERSLTNKDLLIIFQKLMLNQ